MQRFPNCWARPLVGRVDGMKDMFILNEIWEGAKLYILMITVFALNIVGILIAWYRYRL
jgi:hypothetical protein